MAKSEGERFDEVEKMTTTVLQREDFAKYDRMELSELSLELLAHHYAARRAAYAAIYHARRVGEILLAVKRRVKHGQFEKWMRENWDQDPSTLQLYRRIARHFDFVLANAGRAPDLAPTIREAKRVLTLRGWSPDIPIDQEVPPQPDRQMGALAAKWRRAERDVTALLDSRRKLTADQVLAVVARALGLRRPRQIDRS